MQLVEILAAQNSLDSTPDDFADRLHLLAVYYVVIYLVWFAALWFHLTTRMVDVPTVRANDTGIPPEVHRQHRATSYFLESPPWCSSTSSPLHRRRMLITPFVE